MPQQSPAQDKLASVGIEAIAELVEQGMTQAELADRFGVATSVLNGWMHAKPERSARVRAAMQASAEALADRGYAELAGAGDTMPAIQKARALEQHWRWRAAIRNPAYRERTDHTVTATMQHSVQTLSLAQLEQIAAQALPMVEEVPPDEQ